MIKQKLAIIAAAVVLAASVTTSQAVLSLNYNSLLNTTIQFGPGSQFSFNPTVGSAASPQFQISSHDQVCCLESPKQSFFLDLFYCVYDESTL